MNRRSFLKNSTLASCVLLVSSWLKAYSGISKNVKVIISARFSGLAATYKLHQKGISFVVPESRSRIGGRVFSHKISDQLVIELGGECVGNSHTRIQELCSEMNLKLENIQFDTHLIYKNEYSPAGKWDYSPSWKQKFEHFRNSH